jgi:hypothetical protein
MATRKKDWRRQSDCKYKSRTHSLLVNSTFHWNLPQHSSSRWKRLWLRNQVYRAAQQILPRSRCPTSDCQSSYLTWWFHAALDYSPHLRAETRKLVMVNWYWYYTCRVICLNNSFGSSNSKWTSVGAVLTWNIKSRDICSLRSGWGRSIWATWSTSRRGCRPRIGNSSRVFFDCCRINSILSFEITILSWSMIVIVCRGICSDTLELKYASSLFATGLKY